MPHPFVYYTYNMEKQFRKYLNGTCNPNEFSEVIKSFCALDNNIKVKSDILELWNDSSREELEDVGNCQLLDKIHHRIALEESIGIARRFVWYRNMLRIAAVLIIGLLISNLMFHNSPQILPEISEIEKVTTPYGARTSFMLPDGSEVWLNSGSTLSFNKQFGKSRDVELIGQAYFKVVKNGTPFFVKTSYGNVEVKGTSFDVKAYLLENFETTLVEGSVKVSNKINQVATLEPGQQLVITPANEFSLNKVNSSLITSWREGKLTFIKEPFQNVAKELERWYNVKIELKGEKLKQLCYTGTIEMETFSEVLDLIKVTTPIKYKFNKNTRILKISGM
jgi:transmembrane sensor